MSKEEILEKKEKKEEIEQKVSKNEKANTPINKETDKKVNKELKKEVDKKEDKAVNKKIDQEVNKEINKGVNTEENKEQKKQNIKHQKNNKDKKEKKSKKKVVVLTIIIILLLIILVPFGIIFVMNNFNENIVDGIKVQNINVSKMSVEEAKNVLNEYMQKKVNKNIVLVSKEYEMNTTIEQAGITFNIDKAIEDAYNMGRDGNIISNNLNILQTMLNGENINLDISIDEKKFSNLVQEINGSLQNEIQQPNYYINGSELIVTSGKEGNAVNEEELKNIICNVLNSQDENNDNSEEKVEIPIRITKQDEINLDNIYNEIHKEAQDAYVTKDPFEVHPHVDGVDFSISLDEAKNLLQEEKEEYKIPLKITKPSVTTDSLGDEAFPNMLATYSTQFSTADTNRSTNILISVNKINGVVLMPGEEFSYNKILGPRTPQAGYKLGAAYIGGKVVSDYGGGVCQTSSTLYNSVLLSNLEVTSRTSHYFAAAYVPIGRDATVYWPSLDFKFKNNRNYPIRIKASAINGTVQVDIFGVKEDSDYEVELDSYVTGYVPFKTEYKDDNTLTEGKEVVEQAGSNGTKSETYKILKKDGEVISKTLVSRDTYSGKNKIVRRGTKKVVQETKQENTSSNNSSEAQKNSQSQSNTQTNNNEQNKQQNAENNNTNNNSNNNTNNNTNNSTVKKNET